MHNLNLCQDFKGYDKTQLARDDSFLHLSEDFYFSIPKQFPLRQFHFTG